MMQKHAVNRNLWRSQECKHQIYFTNMLFLWRKLILDQQLWAAFPSKSNQKQR